MERRRLPPGCCPTTSRGTTNARRGGRCAAGCSQAGAAAAPRPAAAAAGQVSLCERADRGAPPDATPPHGSRWQQAAQCCEQQQWWRRQRLRRQQCRRTELRRRRCSGSVGPGRLGRQHLVGGGSGGPLLPAARLPLRHPARGAVQEDPCRGITQLVMGLLQLFDASWRTCCSYPRVALYAAASPSPALILSPSPSGF